MSKRSQWVEYDKETRKYIKKRDKEQCVICHKKGGLQIMHIFLNRSHGGKGCKENGCLGCVTCHNIIDNPIGEEKNKLSKKYLEYCKNYLIEKESITYNKEFIESLKYKKTYDIIKIPKDITTEENKCKNCKYISKKGNYNSSISTYYCMLKKQKVNKNNSCKFYLKNY